MKVDVEVRQFFQARKLVADELKKTVDPYILGRKMDAWHYQSRVKTEESFALKLETGFINDPSDLDDFFAGVIVVPTSADIGAAKKLVIDKFKLSHQRPPRPAQTHKDSHSFQFDDLRLYVRYIQSESEPPVNFNGMLFEIQIRTFLQHAWSVATHDLTYKTATLSWRRERIAYQVRALLEQAEVSVENIATLEQSAALPETTKDYTAINKLIGVLHDHWPVDQLPSDVKRLAMCLYKLFEALGIRPAPSELEEILTNGKSLNGGAHALDWSPYRSVMNYVARTHPDKIRALLANSDTRVRVFIYPELLEELGIDRAAAVAGVFLA